MLTSLFTFVASARDMRVRQQREGRRIRAPHRRVKLRGKGQTRSGEQGATQKCPAGKRRQLNRHGRFLRRRRAALKPIHSKIKNPNSVHDEQRRFRHTRIYFPATTGMTMKTNLKSSVLGVIYGNRDFFPDALVTEARADIAKLFGQLGIKAIQLGESDSKLGGVETHNDARKCAELFKKHADEIDGVLVCPPNFGDERAWPTRSSSPG